MQHPAATLVVQDWRGQAGCRANWQIYNRGDRGKVKIGWSIGRKNPLLLKSEDYEACLARSHSTRASPLLTDVFTLSPSPSPP